MVFGSNIASATIIPYDDVPASSPALETKTLLEETTGGGDEAETLLPVDDSHAIVENNNTTTMTSPTDISASFSVKLHLSTIRSNGDFLVKQDNALRITLTVKLEETKNKDVLKMKLSNAKVGMIADCKFGAMSKYCVLV